MKKILISKQQLLTILSITSFLVLTFIKAEAGQYTGRWEGTTSQGLPIALTVNNEDIINLFELCFEYTWWDGNTCEYTFEPYEIDIPINLDGSFEGTVEFISPKTGTKNIEGTLSGSFTGETGGGNWSVTYLHLPCAGYMYTYYSALGVDIFNYNVVRVSPLNSPPVIDSFTANPTCGMVPLTVTFICTAHDPDGWIAEYRWDFNGDGNIDETTTANTTTYTYQNAGTHNAKVTIVDNENATSVSDPISITVSSGLNEPQSDIEVNNSDGPITLNQLDTLIVTVALNNNGITENADWWLAADTPFGLYFFTFEGWTTDWIPAYQGPLFPLDSYEVLNMPVSGLPPGTYTLYFGVDTYMDRNVTWDSVYYDTVVVNITEANGYVSPTILWEKTFGGTDHDSGYSVQQTSDGGYIIVGETSSYGAGDFDVYLIKTDSEGNRMWEKTFGGTKGDHGYSVQQTSDGGYIIVGETSSYGVGYTNVYLIKTNPEGNLVWQKTFGSFDGTGCNSGYSVKQISDGSYVIVGSNGSDVYLIKVDSQGNLVWEKTFGGTKGDHGCSVQQTLDGGYIIVGKTSSYGAGDFDVYLIKTDSEGNRVWEKTFGGPSWDDGECVQQTSDGGYIIVGQTGWTTPNSDVYLIKVDSQGNLVWEKTFGGTDHDSGYSVQQTSDGGYIVVGATGSVGLSWRDIYLLKVDSQGNLVWEKTFGGTKSTWGPSIERTSDGAYVIVGGIEYDEANKEDVLLAKIREQ